MEWYKRNCTAALDGMRNLSDSEFRVYNVILDLFYAREGNLPDDDLQMAKLIGKDRRDYVRIKQRLIDKGKISIEGGRIHNRRADVEIAQFRKISGKSLENPDTPLNDINDLQSAEDRCNREPLQGSSVTRRRGRPRATRKATRAAHAQEPTVTYEERKRESDEFFARVKAAKANGGSPDGEKIH